MKTGELVYYMCVPLPVPYCWGILQAKDMPAVLHSVPLKRSCVRCVATGENIISSEMGCQRLLRETRMISSRFLEIPRNRAGSLEEENEVDQEEERAVVKRY